MTYNVFGGTLNIALSTYKVHFWHAGTSSEYVGQIHM